MKDRDFYDLYYLLRKNMVTGEQKRELASYAVKIVQAAESRDFKRELSTFLPVDQHSIIKNFAETLKGELSRQLGI